MTNLDTRYNILPVADGADVDAAPYGVVVGADGAGVAVVAVVVPELAVENVWVNAHASDERLARVSPCGY